MSGTTKYLISEQVMFRLEPGYPDINAPVQREDIYKATEQKINSKFKLQQFTINLPQGGTIPDNLALATYQDIEVERIYNEWSRATLPVMPISLPRNAGIHEIRPVLSQANNADKMLGSPLIPLQAGQYYLLQADTLLNDLMGQIGYEPEGKYVIIKKDLTTLGVTKVDMKLVVFDISLYGDTDILPVPSDMEEQIVNELVEQFSGKQPESGLVNKTNDVEK